MGRQVAHLPSGFTPANAYANNVYSVSYPVAGTDTYPAAFADTLPPGTLLPEPDPFAVNPQSLSRSLTLQPYEATIVGIAMRSFGMCANGSCNERLVKVEGTFGNGDPALACVEAPCMWWATRRPSPFCANIRMMSKYCPIPLQLPRGAAHSFSSVKTQYPTPRLFMQAISRPPKGRGSNHLPGNQLLFFRHGLPAYDRGAYRGVL